MKKSHDQTLEHMIRRMQSDVAVDAPADAIQLAKNLFRVRATQPKESIFRRVLAVMSVDLAPGTAAFGERSAGEGQARQVLFDSGENAVDLRIREVKNDFTIRGQILGNSFEDGTVKLVNDTRSFATKIDDKSEFLLERVGAGEYSMTIRGREREIIIESLSII